MEIKGIAKGDKYLRHFTFDDNDYVVRGGVYYYKVNYGKNPLEGEYGDDETGYVECSKVIPLGGKKPKAIPGKATVVKEAPEVKTPAQEEISTEPKKRGRKPKVEKVEASTETIGVAAINPDSYGTYEYYVTDVKAGDVTELQNKLNELGKERWELCGFDTNKSLFGSIHIVAVFKRKRG